MEIIDNSEIKEKEVKPKLNDYEGVEVIEEETTTYTEPQQIQQPQFKEPDTLPKIVFAKEKYQEAKNSMLFCAVNIIVFFICVMVSLSWLTLIAGACGIGWNVVKLVKEIKLRKYLENKYNLKNE